MIYPAGILTQGSSLAKCAPSADDIAELNKDEDIEFYGPAACFRFDWL